MLTIIDHLLLDHARLRTLLQRVQHADEDELAEAIRVLVDLLVRHETAEAALVRPRTRACRGGAAVAASLDRQERRLSRIVAALETVDPEEGARLREVLTGLRSQLLRHLDAEEHAEHPRLQGQVPQAALHELGRRYVRATGLDVARAGGSGQDGARSFARVREVVRASLVA